MLGLSPICSCPELAGQRRVNRPPAAPPPGCHGLGARVRGMGRAIEIANGLRLAEEICVLCGEARPSRSPMEFATSRAHSMKRATAGLKVRLVNVKNRNRPCSGRQVDR